MPQQHSNTTMNINRMTITLLKQELTQRGLPTDGLKPTLIERLQLTMPWMNSNEASTRSPQRPRPQRTPGPRSTHSWSTHRQQWSALGQRRRGSQWSRGTPL